MQSKMQKSTLILLLLTCICAVGVVIGFIVVTSPIVVTFDTKGDATDYQGEYISKVKVSAGSTVQLPTPMRPGYTFEGWYQGTKKVTKITKKNTHLVANWQKNNITASLYLHDELLRQVIIPENQQNGLQSEFILLPDVDSDAYSSFSGWYYFNENGQRVDLIYTSGTWSTTVDYGAAVSVGLNSPFTPSVHDIALNARVAYKAVGIEYYAADGVTKIGSTVGTVNNTDIRYNMTITVNPTTLYEPEVGMSLVGWKLNDESTSDADYYDDSDIYQAGASFFIDPKYYNLRNKTSNVLKFTAVVTPTPTGVNVRDQYIKSIEDGRVVLTKTTSTTGNSAGINIVDETVVSVSAVPSIAFDFAGNKRSELKDTAPVSSGRFPKIVSDETVFVDVDVKTGIQMGYANNNALYIQLPLANKYGVENMVFVGWQSSLDEEIYSAGLVYKLPRGLKADALEFTAIWKSGAFELVSFNLNGGSNGTDWNESQYLNKKSGDSVTLPTPIRYGYTFAGWKTYPWLANSDVFLPESAFTLQSVKTILTAQWVPNQNNLTMALFANVTFGNSPYDTTVFSFGDTVVLKRITEPEYSHFGWSFPDRSKSLSGNEHVQFLFGAPFVDSIKIVINEDFCIKHIGKVSDTHLFDTNPYTPYSIVGNAIEVQ